MRFRSFHLHAVVLAATIAADLGAQSSQLCAPPWQEDGLRLNFSQLPTALTFSSDSAAVRSTLTSSINTWATKCFMIGILQGLDYPDLSVLPAGQTGFIEVLHFSSGSLGFCADTEASYSGGSGVVRSIEISVWDFDALGEPCDLAATLNHELGHVLGIDEARDSRCSGHVMQFPGNDFSAACQTADSQYPQTEPDICLDPFDPECTGDCSPIIIDLDRNGIDLTSFFSGVAFDLNGDGHVQITGWTSGVGQDAFLALDRNGNGVIDGAPELFGTATPLSDGSLPPDGFVALGELDERALGGNGDGVISAYDERLWDLALWIDLDHDGKADASEIVAASEVVRSIELGVTTSERQDVHGNQFRLIATAIVKAKKGRWLPTWAVDVFFIALP